MSDVILLATSRDYNLVIHVEGDRRKYFIQRRDDSREIKIAELRICNDNTAWVVHAVMDLSDIEMVAKEERKYMVAEYEQTIRAFFYGYVNVAAIDKNLNRE